MPTAEQIIQRLNLQPLPLEGGFFRRAYLAPETLPAAALPERYGHDKPFASCIYYLLQGDDFSALHRLLTDEIYHFYLGDPVEMLLLSPDRASRIVTLGRDLEAGQHMQVVVPRGVWQGARLAPGGRWALMGTTMAPAWDEGDFELGEREALIRKYPERAELIRVMTRTEA